MYDTIAGYQETKSLSNCEKKHIGYLLSRPTESRNEYGYSVTGNYMGLRIKLTDKKLGINGSLAKFALGDNIKTLGIQQAKSAIESLSEALKIDLKGMSLTRVDIAQNLIMKNPLDAYYNRLGVLKLFKRVPFENGITYRNSKQELLFYGKLNEMKDKLIPIPEIWRGSNMLRIEYRLKGRIYQSLNRSSVILSDLYCENFYITLLNRWAETYFKVQKLNQVIMKPTKSAKDLEQQLALVGINSLGQNHCLEIVKEWQLTGAINKKQAYEMRKKLTSLNKLKTASVECELIQELNRKVKDSIVYYR